MNTDLYWVVNKLDRRIRITYFLFYLICAPFDAWLNDLKAAFKPYHSRYFSRTLDIIML